MKFSRIGFAVALFLLLAAGCGASAGQAEPLKPGQPYRPPQKPSATVGNRSSYWYCAKDAERVGHSVRPGKNFVVMVRDFFSDPDKPGEESFAKLTVEIPRFKGAGRYRIGPQGVRLLYSKGSSASGETARSFDARGLVTFKFGDPDRSAYAAVLDIALKLGPPAGLTERQKRRVKWVPYRTEILMTRMKLEALDDWIAGDRLRPVPTDQGQTSPDPGK